jgi:DNA-binding GntR family transcriptional regulator
MLRPGLSNPLFGRSLRQSWSARLLAAALLVAGSSGCAVSPAEQQAIRDAWAARDAERAAECRQHNVGFAAGGCVAGGP